MTQCVRRAFTLIETLLAIAIAAVIFALAVSLFTSTSRTLVGQEKRLGGDVAMLEAFRQLERDLLQSVHSHGLSNQVFSVREHPDREESSILQFATLRRVPNEPHMSWAEVIQVTYQVNEGGELVREAQRTRGLKHLPESPQVLLSDVTSFTVQALQGAEQIALWPRTEKDDLPSGVHLELAVEGKEENPISAKIIIPASIVVKSSLKRVGSD